MKEIAILQDDIDNMFKLVADRWPDFDISDYETRYNYITDIDTNEIRLEPEAIAAAQTLLNDLIIVYTCGLAL